MRRWVERISVKVLAGLSGLAPAIFWRVMEPRTWAHSCHQTIVEGERGLPCFSDGARSAVVVRVSAAFSAFVEPSGFDAVRSIVVTPS